MVDDLASIQYGVENRPSAVAAGEYGIGIIAVEQRLPASLELSNVHMIGPVHHQVTALNDIIDKSIFRERRVVVKMSVMTDCRDDAFEIRFFLIGKRWIRYSMKQYSM